LSKLPKQDFTKDVLVGFETSDDAGVFKLDDKTALVQTVDFFTPVADEPEIYGQIAAINSLNDIYAMGGTPLTALSIVCYPQKGDWNVLGEIMLGGQKALNVMTTSAAVASKLMNEVGANGCTDITGFGLLGHCFEMAKASTVTLKIMSDKIPLLPDVLELIEQKMLTRGDRNNRIYVGENIKMKEKVTSQMQSALFDPQTAGGLLISLEKDKANYLVKKLEGATIIGEVEEFSGFLIEVE